MYIYSNKSIIQCFKFFKELHETNLPSFQSNLLFIEFVEWSGLILPAVRLVQLTSLFQSFMTQTANHGARNIFIKYRCK